MMDCKHCQEEGMMHCTGCCHTRYAHPVVGMDAAEGTVMDRPDQMISQPLLALRSVALSIMFFSSRVFSPQEGTFSCDHPRL